MEQQAINLFKRFCPKGQKQVIINQDGHRVMVVRVGHRKIVTKEVGK